VVPLWAWFALTAAIMAMLAVDLFMHRDNHVVEFKEAAIWSAIWIAFGLAFGVVMWWASAAKSPAPTTPAT
jgi:tellurite resistance protein TerC